MTTAPKSPIAGRLTLRLPEVAELTGASTSTVQRWVASGDLPAVRPPGGGVVLIRPADLETFLEAHLEGRGIKPAKRFRNTA